MQVFLAGLAACAGFVLVVAGLKGNGSNLFAGVTGTQVKSSTGLQPGVSGAVNAAPATPPLGPTGPGMVGPVTVA